jgi:hypothetical protein
MLRGHTKVAQWNPRRPAYSLWCGNHLVVGSLTVSPDVASLMRFDNRLDLLKGEAPGDQAWVITLGH